METKLKITCCGKEYILQPRLELYLHKIPLLENIDGCSGKSYGLAIVFDEVDSQEQFGVATVSLGEHINIKNAACMDTNNSEEIAKKLLETGVAKDTGYKAQSGFCQYPLFVFSEDYLRSIGEENYKKYLASREEVERLFG